MKPMSTKERSSIQYFSRYMATNATGEEQSGSAQHESEVW